MIRYFCDRCNAEIFSKDDSFQVRYQKDIPRKDGELLNERVQDLKFICKNCNEELLEFFG